MKYFDSDCSQIEWRTFSFEDIKFEIQACEKVFFSFVDCWTISFLKDMKELASTLAYTNIRIHEHIHYLLCMHT